MSASGRGIYLCVRVEGFAPPRDFSPSVLSACCLLFQHTRMCNVGECCPLISRVPNETYSCFREDLNFSRQPSQGCVPILGTETFKGECLTRFPFTRKIVTFYRLAQVVRSCTRCYSLSARDFIPRTISPHFTYSPIATRLRQYSEALMTSVDQLLQGLTFSRIHCGLVTLRSSDPHSHHRVPYSRVKSIQPLPNGQHLMHKLIVVTIQFST